MRLVVSVLMVAMAQLCEAKVLGKDNRQQILDPVAQDTPGGIYAARKVGLLQASHFGEDPVSCTATLIGANHILTAAHCIFDNNASKPYDNIEFFPRKVAENLPSPSRIYIKSGWILKNYIKYNTTERNEAFGDYLPVKMSMQDLAILEAYDPLTQQGLGKRYGSLAVRALPFNLKQLNYDKHNMYLLSYPGDKPAETLWYENCSVSHHQDNIASTSCDTHRGASGAAVIQFMKNDSMYAVSGVVSTESRNYNGITWFTPRVFADLMSITSNNKPANGLFKKLSFDTEPQRYFAVINKCNEKATVAISYKDSLNRYTTISEVLPPGEVLKTGSANGNDYYYWAASNSYIWAGNERQIEAFGQKHKSLKITQGTGEDGKAIYGDFYRDLNCN